MAKPAPILSPELKAYATERYLAGNVPPRELVTELSEKFGVTVRNSALRQWLTRSGLGKRKAALDRETCAIVSSAKVTAIAKTRAEEPRKLIERWASKTVTAADRAFDMVGAATRPRDLASAASAANTSIRLYRLLVGIEGPESRPAGSTFNYNFASYVPTRVSVTPQGHAEIEIAPTGSPAAPVLSGE